MIRAALALMALAGCLPDETVAGYGAGGQTWVLTELDGVPFSARATITFPERGQIAGDAPCNSYSATMTAPYPWFEAGAITATRMACPDLPQEAQFFDALRAMTLSEVSGTVLILSNDQGRNMVFTASDPAR